MVSKGNHPQMALIQVSEIFCNLRIYIYIYIYIYILINFEKKTYQRDDWLRRVFSFDVKTVDILGKRSGPSPNLQRYGSVKADIPI